MGLTELASCFCWIVSCVRMYFYFTRGRSVVDHDAACRLVRLVAELVLRVHREENVTLRRGPVLAIHADKVVLARLELGIERARRTHADIAIASVIARRVHRNSEGVVSLVIPK